MPHPNLKKLSPPSFLEKNPNQKTPQNFRNGLLAPHLNFCWNSLSPVNFLEKFNQKKREAEVY